MSSSSPITEMHHAILAEMKSQKGVGLRAEPNDRFDNKETPLLEKASNHAMDPLALSSDGEHKDNADALRIAQEKLNLIKKAIEQSDLSFVQSALSHDPKLLSIRIKSEGEKPVVFAAKQQQWTIMLEIAQSYWWLSDEGDFHKALLWALKTNTPQSITTALALDLNRICTSAETLGDEKNVLHYAMLINKKELIEKIFSIKDNEMLEALIVNKNSDGDTPIICAARNKKWVAVQFHMNPYEIRGSDNTCSQYRTILESALKDGGDLAAAIQLQMKRGNTYSQYRAIFEMALENGSDSALEAALTVMATYALKDITLKDAWFITMIEILLEEDVYDSPQNKLFRIKIFNQLLDLLKREQIQPIFSGLEKTIKKGSVRGLKFALLLLDKDASKKIQFPDTWLKERIEILLIGKSVQDPLRNTVLSHLLNLSNDGQIATLIAHIASFSQQWFKTRVRSDNSNNEISGEEKREIIIEDIKNLLINQITSPQIQLRIIQALLTSAEPLFTNMREYLIALSIEILSSNTGGTLTEALAISFFQKTAEVIKTIDGDTSEKKSTISKTLFEQTKKSDFAEIQLEIFNHLVMRCNFEKRVNIIKTIAQRQSAGVAETFESNMILLIQGIEDIKVKAEIILNILACSEFSIETETELAAPFTGEMPLKLIKGFILGLREGKRQQWSNQIPEMIKGIDQYCSLSRETVELFILQDFLRVIVGQEPVLTEIRITAPEEIQATIEQLYGQTIAAQENLKKIFLEHLTTQSANPNSLICKSIKPKLTKRKLSADRIPEIAAHSLSSVAEKVPGFSPRNVVSSTQRKLSVDRIPEIPAQSPSSMAQKVPGFSPRNVVSSTQRKLSMDGVPAHSLSSGAEKVPGFSPRNVVFSVSTSILSLFPNTLSSSASSSDPPSHNSSTSTSTNASPREGEEEDKKEEPRTPRPQ
ncbi:MAG: hypothetical protein K0R48_639 [Gammaproteobacteria bacterium]|nr:hypothetical protein [Gammaproteobacteria bacterium]